MVEPGLPSPLPPRSRSSLALHNLRGIVILIVLAFHSALAYVSWVVPSKAGFDSPPYQWRAFPIVDSDRFFGFDLFCAWQDVYLMALMFFLSGLFVWPSLTRKRTIGFVRDRMLRLGIPYLFGIVVVIPLAVYPAFRVTAADAGFVAYWHALLRLPFWPNGPLWFIWQLLALNIAAGLLNWLVPGALPALGRWSAAAETHIGRYLAALLAASALAYVPLAYIFTPWAWSNSGLFAVQFCRPLLYAVFFFAGVGIGVTGIDRGLIAADGVLRRHWARWLAAALGSLLLWMGLTVWWMHSHGTGAEIASEFSYAPACAAGGFFLIAVTLRYLSKPSRVLGALGTNAYALYLLHYVFVVWLQFALLTAPLIAPVKAVIVFSGALVGSLIGTAALQRLPFGPRLIGLRRPPFAGLPHEGPPGSGQRSRVGAVRST